MSRIRRALAVTGLALAVVVGGAFPALAGWSTSDGVDTTISTVAVTPPTEVKAEKIQCRFNNYRLVARVFWEPSTTERITGYTVTAYINDNFVHEHHVDATAGSANLMFFGFFADVTFTVTTHTDYGWTAESARTASVRC
ncbi:hypothetical protein [Blastococcus saxobsidens]|uniref:Fibronectin type III domain-containing protein n=1 Tax=Blastococcus saxobsidens (strain DD2) TaxID=1146883 RepID=H6RW61_BLASD|nr:hypothetical protein [Blastococcus saxobsidens]CCG02078.1 exported protein of unknown function [Blastococcus saxobsidens DD2]